MTGSTRAPITCKREFRNEVAMASYYRSVPARAASDRDGSTNEQEKL